MAATDTNHFFWRCFVDTHFNKLVDLMVSVSHRIIFEYVAIFKDNNSGYPIRSERALE